MPGPPPARRDARTFLAVVALTAGCSTGGQQDAPATSPTPTSPTPTGAPPPAAAAPKVSWRLPDVPGYEAAQVTVPGVRQLTSVADACLYQLAEDRLPPGASGPDAELVAPALRALGGEPTGTAPSMLTSAEGPWEAVEVDFTAEVEGRPAEGVVLVSVPPGGEVLLSVSYVCTDRPVPQETWEALREGTQVTVTRAG